MSFENISVVLSTNTGRFKNDMAMAADAVHGFATASLGAINKIESAGKAIGAAAVATGVSILGLAAVSAKAAISLETVINNVSTVWDLAGQKVEGTFLSLGDASQQLLDLSTKLPQSANDLAEGLYNVASSGFQGTDAMIVLEKSAIAATAGMTSTDVAARAVTGVLNAYGKGAEEAAYISDVLFSTVKLGVITFEEASASMGDFVSTAAAAGVSIEEVSALFATMTLAGINAAEASTATNRVLQEFIKPSEALTAQMQSLGFETGIAALEQLGLHGTLTAINKVVGDNVTAYAELFPEMRAQKGALAAMAGEGENYARIFGVMTDKQALFGTTQEEFDKQAQGAAFQLTVLKNSVTKAAVEFGQVLLPAVKFVTEIMQTFVDGINAIPDGLKTAIAIIGGVVAVLAILLGLYITHKLAHLGLTLAMRGTIWAMNALSLSTTGLATAFKILQYSVPILLGVVALATVAMTIFGHSQKDTEAAAEELTDTLDKQTGSITEQTRALVRQQAVRDGLDKDAAAFGVTLDDLIDAQLGNADAAARVNTVLDGQQAALDAAAAAAHAHAQATGTDQAAALAANDDRVAHKKAVDAFRGSIEEKSSAIKDGTAAIVAETEAAKADKAAVEANTTAQQKAMKIREEGLKVIKKELDSVFDLAAAYQLASDELNKTDDTRSKTEDRNRSERHRIQRAALDDQVDAERSAFENANRDYERGVEERRRLEDDQIEQSAEARTIALDDRQTAEENALDLVLRTQKNAFDDQLRLQRDAHADRMEELRDENDELIEAENEAWELRQQDLQHHIDDTFGVARQGWQQVLKDEEDLHDDRVDTIEEAGDQRVRAEGNAFDDQIRTQEQAFADQETVQKTALARRHDNETRALADDIEAIKRGVEDKRRIADQSWSDLVALDAARMTERQTAAQTGLDRAQQAEDDAADLRVARSNEKHPVTLAALQAQIDLELEQRAQMNRDLVKIAEEGGKDVNEVILGKIAELGPEGVAAVAAGTPAAIEAWVTSIAKGLELEDASIDAVFEAAGKNALDAFSKGMTNQDWLLNHPLFGGLGLPAPTRADGGVYRYAAGGFENHVAQIAPAGSWRVWAEPETGGEAYIPLAMSKRGRSTSILAETAGIFGLGLTGLANGGIVGGSAVGGGTVVNISVETKVAADVDVGKVHALVGQEVGRTVGLAFDQLGRQVTVKAWR